MGEGVENFDEIALSPTVKEIEAILCFRTFSKNSNIRNVLNCIKIVLNCIKIVLNCIKMVLNIKIVLNCIEIY